MRLRILILFVAIQICSFALYQALNGDIWVPGAAASSTTHLAAASPFSHLHFSSMNGDNLALARSEERLKKEIVRTLKKLPKTHAQAVKNIILDFDPEAHRGLGGKEMIILRASMDQAEFTSVLIHELGHNVDLIALTAPKAERISAFRDGKTLIYMGDPSLDFYRISWENEDTLKRTAGNLDFVSGYAMQDSFEDFAETYIYYVLHNQEFKAKVSSSAALYAKYRFMKYRVFGNQEFNTGNVLAADPLARPWDVTVIPYNLSTFLK